MLVEERIRELAKQPFIRPGATIFDIPYAMSVWDARLRVELAEKVAMNPGKAVAVYEGGEAVMGYVPFSQITADG